jgi:hypothetical protein
MFFDCFARKIVAPAATRGSCRVVAPRKRLTAMAEIFNQPSFYC